MKHVFFFFSIFAILWEYVNLTETERVKGWLNRVFSSKGKGLSSVDRLGIFFLFGYLIWTMLGLFTNQWMIFFYLTFIGFVNKGRKFPKLDALVCIHLLLFALLNEYHFHINLIRW